MEKADKKKIGQFFGFWVSHSLKCLSFHPESRFELLDFADHTVMWQKVHEFVDKGYVVQ